MMMVMMMMMMMIVGDENSARSSVQITARKESYFISIYSSESGYSRNCSNNSSFGKR